MSNRLPERTNPSAARARFRIIDSNDTRGTSISYELRHVLCGKKGCARLHGPYWYAYWRAGTRTRSYYVGKEFRPVWFKANGTPQKRRDQPEAEG